MSARYRQPSKWDGFVRSVAYEIAEMLRELAAIFKLPVFVLVRQQNTPNAHVYFECPTPVEDINAHWFAWALGVRKWDSYENGTRAGRQWFRLHDVSSTVAEDASPAAHLS